MTTPEDSRVVTNKARQQILHLIASQPLSIQEIAEKLSMKPVAVRHHVKILRDAGLIEEWEYKRGQVGRPVIQYRALERPRSGSAVPSDTLWFYEFFQRPVLTIVKRGLFTVEKDGTVLDAAEIMRDNGLGSVIVTDVEKPVGILTERDIVYKIVARNILPLDGKVWMIMSKPVITIQSNSTIAEALEIMAKNKVRRLLVHRGEESVGMVTESDIINAFVLESGIRVLKERRVALGLPRVIRTEEEAQSPNEPISKE